MVAAPGRMLYCPGRESEVERGKEGRKGKGKGREASPEEGDELKRETPLLEKKFFRVSF